ncbi:MAG: NAD(P)H-dependent glycerol-3-phosphate dehydrogenase [Candidatus Omnitrophota bacterium]
MIQKLLPITVIGDGAWGTTLAVLLAEKGYPVTLWGAFPEYVARVRASRINEKFLPGIRIPDGVWLTASLKDAITGGSIIVLAVPSQYLTSTIKKIRRLDVAGKDFVSVVKGIDTATFLTMSQLISKELGQVRVAVLSGPTIAIEVAKKIPTTAVSASLDGRFARKVQEIFSSAAFRVYTNRDVLGVEICGSVKNVIALACGICDGLGFGTNTKAALLTRGLVEMTRLGKVFGANPKTFTGLAGLGDLATTCFSPNSRNRFVGSELGKGRSIKDILSSMNAVAEGVVTAKAVYHIARKHKIDMPITTAVYEVVYGHGDPQKAVAGLMGRTLRSE